MMAAVLVMRVIVVAIVMRTEEIVSGRSESREKKGSVGIEKRRVREGREVMIKKKIKITQVMKVKQKNHWIM